MKHLFAECFTNPNRVSAMKNSFQRLEFFTFEMRTLGVIRVAIVVVSGFIMALASVRSNSPIPLFLLLAITIQSFVGSLFPRRGVTVNLANPSLGLPLFTFAAVFHFAAQLLWPFYQENLAQRAVAWFSIILITLALAQFAYSTLGAQYFGKSNLIRWPYAVISLVIVVFDRTARHAASYSSDVEVLLEPLLQPADLFLTLDFVLLSGFLILIVVEGTLRWLEIPNAWGPKCIYEPIEYPKDDVAGSFFRSIPRDARLRLFALVSWITVQLKNLWRLVYGVLTGLWTLICEVTNAAVRYGKAGLCAGILLIANVVPLFLISFAIFLAYRSALNVAKPQGEFFVLAFFAYIFGAACVLLMAYLTHYYLFAKPIARHFRQSFLGFIHFSVLVGMLIGGGFWYRAEEQFAPGYAFYFAIVVYSILGVGIYINRSEIGRNKASSNAYGKAVTTSGSSEPSYWVFFLMLTLAGLVALKQWRHEPAVNRLVSIMRIAVPEPDNVWKKPDTVASAKAEAMRQEEQGRRLEEQRVKGEKEAVAKAEAARAEEQARKLEEVRAQQEEAARAETMRREEQARNLEAVRGQRAKEAARQEAMHREEEARKVAQARTRQEAEAKADAVRRAEQERRLQDAADRQEMVNKAIAEVERIAADESKHLPACAGQHSIAWNNCYVDMTYPNGLRYAGRMEAGKQDGLGMTFWPDGQRYLGQYRDGRRNGRGVLMWKGNKYVGGFEESKFHGKGLFIFPSGQQYVGEYLNGKRHGQGTQYNADGVVIGSGFWENDKCCR